MKGAYFVLVLAVICAADLNPLAIGQSCNTKSTFVVTNFVINPYPPTTGIQMTVNMSGTFGQDQYIADIAIRTSYNKGAYVYKYVDIAQKFNYGQIYTFSFPMTAGNSAGLYDVQVLLESKQGSAISCWEFSYHI